MNVDRMSADDVLACARCGQKAAHTMIFYVVHVTQAMVDVRAAQQQAGLEAMVGSPEVAAALGTRDVIQRWPYGTGEAHVCSECMVEIPLGEIMGAMEREPEGSVE